ncbi:hypothetical protein ILYODFUR_034800 [Ilyodon furcidens]|uniref:Uncharacterized protein n=1 Tax=Ilyodon furcidens TaxID=33524 RepID=A0ABV0UAU9_9TELE
MEICIWFWWKSVPGSDGCFSLVLIEFGPGSDTGLYLVLMEVFSWYLLDHVLLNIGPFARCWMPTGLPAVLAILYPRTVCYYKSQRPLRLIGRGVAALMPQSTI